MRAAQLTASRPELEVTDVPDPEPGPGEVLVRVSGCGICGSDLHLAAAVAGPGTVLGHEIAGTVAELGAGVAAEQVRVGTAVAVRPFVGCGDCSWCDDGRQDHCDHFAMLGLQRTGGFGELVTVPAHELYRLPTHLVGAEQALVEPLAIARQSLRRARLGPRDRVLVVGGGPIGLAVTAWCRALGVDRLLVSEPVEVRRTLAVALGADQAVDPVGGDLGTAVAETLGGPPDLVVECSGAPGMIGEAMAHATPRGRVVVVGMLLTEDTFFPFFGLDKELDVRFSMFYDPIDYVDTIAALEDRSLDAAAMITETVRLDDLPARFLEMSRVPDAGKVVIEF